MCTLVKWNNETIVGSFLLFQKTTWNGLHSEEEHILEGRNQMSWTHQSSRLSENHHFPEHQPWCSCCSLLVFFLRVILVFFWEYGSYSHYVAGFKKFSNFWSMGFSSCTHHFSSTPNSVREKPKTRLRITYTNCQFVRSLRIANL